MERGTMARAEKALIDYGYTVLPDGSLERGRKGERYVPVEGGFLRWFRGEPMCFKIKAAFATVSGADPKKNPEAFEMVYPSAWVIEHFETAVANNKRWAAEAAARKAG